MGMRNSLIKSLKHCDVAYMHMYFVLTDGLLLKAPRLFSLSQRLILVDILTPTFPLKISVNLCAVHVLSLLYSARTRQWLNGTISLRIFLQCVLAIPALSVSPIDGTLRRSTD